MPRRQTVQRGPKDRETQKAKPRQKRRQNARSLDALAIAEKQFPERVKIRRSRLGEAEEDPSKRKRSAGRDRDGDDDDDDDDENEGRRPDNKRRRMGLGDSSDNGGSDSEGREWRIGEVDSDNDSELDSDEAMGSSDEERFEGFTFRGSSTNKAKPKPKPSKKRNVNLEEDEEDDYDEDDDDLGSDAIDLTTAWDMNMAEEAEQAAAEKKKKNKQSSANEDPFMSGGSESESDGDDESDESDESDDSALSMSEDEMDGADEQGLSQLQSFVSAMEQNSKKKSPRDPRRAQEQRAPTEYGLTSTKKLTIADLMPTITDSNLKSSLKHVNAVASAAKSASGIPGKLEAPLAKRQQDRLDRAAAYDQSKETLGRWIDTVKANRRAEHLSFPLPDPDAQQSKKLAVIQPQNDLESSIQNILVESGLIEAKGKSAEDQLQEYEDLQARKMPLEEIQARRAELRKRRDLLFREEVRAKRIKKIKSKSYRRVHRKEREKMAQQERQALLEAGVDLDEMEREETERRRAEARMGSKHKESKWAKSLKQTGRTAWDEEARNSTLDQALREEELRKRIEGKRVSRKDDDYLGSSSSESESEEDPWQENQSDTEKRKLRKKLDALQGDHSDDAEPKGPHAKLLSMKFMQNAQAARKAENDAEVRKLTRELHGEESQSEAESEVGRRKFGHKAEKKETAPRPSEIRNEFEEAPDSDEDRGQDIDIAVDHHSGSQQKSKPSAKKTSSAPSGNTPRGIISSKQEAKEAEAEEENPWLVQTNRTNRRLTVGASNETVDISVDETTKQGSKKSVSSKKTASAPAPSSVPVQGHRNDDDDDDEDEPPVPVLLKNHDLVKRAFAGDEVVQDFEQDKLDTIKDEGDQVIENTLPGWGSWTGEGISKKAQKRQKRVVTVVEGVKPENRKDAKLSRVIINEKRVRKNVKYMATQLPHPFENRQQYERSLRLPIGPEWSTKETLQDATKPRVMIKQGIIKPMERPQI
ncbi:hypothetical protein ASPZODRAFT_151194 [Penicilliopsis zonata CBS 506.65]|uniref:Uncharacterized protein n=1 Tax=Penicilliopsis zonata CBS 506.65 TaxID=1073090 RepID=A0A1L9SKQ3_9EURO|nr:hypothetical protein ASPZODRAFT_151194 [Penicilliopsis zonata CBS 506.65]OJJ47745.1 hypothetical protein ASPZODRAFT_151194 [Penicilliopsis zonata CBS 506.65]